MRGVRGEKKERKKKEREKKNQRSHTWNCPEGWGADRRLPRVADTSRSRTFKDILALASHPDSGDQEVKTRTERL